MMNSDRRMFLRGGKPLPIRPPWALPENEFLTCCTRCGDCLIHCPQGILATDWLGYPTVNFSKGGCTFCGACVEHCSEQALVIVEGQPPWHYKAEFTKTCLNSQGITCRTCGEQCDNNAITFHPSPGGRILPQLTSTLCSGCGACCGVCPVTAITLAL
ncbi:MAG: ferredoxin-type protein NapF [Proteobacteria bacterium]|nr:ferredoxin-type protein NapF [Pseudomonadota bacterium]